MNIFADIRNDFPILQQEDAPTGRMIYFDNAATTLKPKCVIDEITRFYELYTSNVGRANHKMAEDISIRLDNARSRVGAFLNVSPTQVVFTANATTAINAVAEGLRLAPSDEVIISRLEHHSNFLPWRQRYVTRIAALGEHGQVSAEEIDRLITKRTRVIAVSAMSNVTGNYSDLRDVIELGRQRNILTLVDLAQAIAHDDFDVSALACDYIAFSGHKIMGPSGVGVLSGKEEALARLSPSNPGGGTVKMVTEEVVHFKSNPERLEGGTPNIEGILGLAAALTYRGKLPQGARSNHLHLLDTYARDRLSAIKGIHFPFVFGQRRAPIISFVPSRKVMPPNEVARLLSDDFDIALGAGFCCCQPYIQSLGLNEGIIRASLYMYNTAEEIDTLAEAIEKVAKLWA